MKRLVLILLVLLLLCGCEKAPAQESDPTTLPTGEPTEPVRSHSLYAPGHSIEQVTGGAVRAYPLEGTNCTGIAAMGDKLVLFHMEDSTRITLLSGDELTVEKEIDLGCIVFPDEPTVKVSENGICYYDMDDHSLVYLDTGLNELRRVLMPEDMLYNMLISEDCSTVYYTTEDSLRAWDVETNISRLIRQQACEEMYAFSLLLNDSMIQCYITPIEGASYCQFISTEDGQEFYTHEALYGIHSTGDRYSADLGEELIFGKAGESTMVLEPVGDYVEMIPVAKGEKAVIISNEENIWILDCYDLLTGARIATLSMELSLWSFAEGSDPNHTWFLAQADPASDVILCRWDMSAGDLKDPACYTDIRYTRDYPNIDGINACKEEAKRIGDLYGVEILLWNDVFTCSSPDYTFVEEYRVSIIEDALKALEAAMARYPEGFLATAAESTKSGTVRICLVELIQGDLEKGTLPDVAGLQYWLGTDAYIALSTYYPVEQNFHHEMFHVIDTHVHNSCVTYDEWDDLNPRGFEYDYDYVANLDRVDTTYLEGEYRAFIDFYSMSFPKEDRARLMEYAMLSSAEEYFNAPIMQDKLYQLCLGIRKAFNLRKYPEMLPWEQYLEKSLVPKN